jgi:hypothetical protein
MLGLRDSLLLARLNSHPSQFSWRGLRKSVSGLSLENSNVRRVPFRPTQEGLPTAVPDELRIGKSDPLHPHHHTVSVPWRELVLWIWEHCGQFLGELQSSQWCSLPAAYPPFPCTEPIVQCLLQVVPKSTLHRAGRMKPGHPAMWESNIQLWVTEHFLQ